MQREESDMRTTTLTCCAVAFVLVGTTSSGWAQSYEPLPRHGISSPRKRCRVQVCRSPRAHLVAASIVALESGLMRHAFTPPTFDSINTVASRGEAMTQPRDRAIAIGPQFLLAIDVSQNVYGGLELAAGRLLSGPEVMSEGVSVSETAFYVGFRAIMGARVALGRVTVAAELAPGLNDVSFESTILGPRGEHTRFCETTYEVDVRTRLDVRITRTLAVGVIGGAGLFDRDDLSMAITLQLRPRPR